MCCDRVKNIWEERGCLGWEEAVPKNTEVGVRTAYMGGVSGQTCWSKRAATGQPDKHGQSLGLGYLPLAVGSG